MTIQPGETNSDPIVLHGVKDNRCKGRGDVTVGNPCSVKSGAKTQGETDIISANLSFTRSYNSLFTANIGMGYGWTTKYHKRLALGGAYYNDMFVVRGNGYNNKFVRQTDGSWKGDDDIDLAVTEDLTGYYVSDKLGNVEYYDFNGILLSETDSAGNVTHYTYDNSEVSNISKLVRVTGPYGHTLNFTYNDDNLVESITDASGTTVSYQYLDGNLISVHFSDGTLREYHYEDLAYPHHLTGITDQTNVRFATWAYDSTGKVILSQHAETENSAPQEKFTLVYDSEWQTTVTDPKGEQEVFTFNKGAIVKNLASRTMSTDNKGIVQSFDASNNLTSRTNEENIKTRRAYWQKIRYIC